MTAASKTAEQGSSPWTHARIYVGVEESGRPRWSHKPEIVGSNPTSATNLRGDKFA